MAANQTKTDCRPGDVIRSVWVMRFMMLCLVPSWGGARIAERDQYPVGLSQTLTSRATSSGLGVGENFPRAGNFVGRVEVVIEPVQGDIASEESERR